MRIPSPVRRDEGGVSCLLRWRAAEKAKLNTHCALTRNWTKLSPWRQKICHPNQAQCACVYIDRPSQPPPERERNE